MRTDNTSAPVRRTRVDMALLAMMYLGILLLAQIRMPVYFRDYTITFEGAYRLFLGQVPYVDFGSPVGPGAFVLPALFFRLFSPDWTTFMWAQQFQNACLLLLLYVLLRRLNCGIWVTRLASAGFALFCLVLLTHPWYNTTGFLLLLATALLTLDRRFTPTAVAGVLAGATILTKQDFGLLSVVIGSLFIAKTCLDPHPDRITADWRKLLQQDFFRDFAGRLLVFLLPVSSLITLFVYATDYESFKYWFNYGQAPHVSRGITLKDLFGTSFGTFGVISASLALARNNFRLLAASIFITAASVSRTTSGLGFTHYYFVPFLTVAIVEAWRLKFRFKYVALFVLLYTSSRMMIRPYNDVFHVFESVAHKQPEHFFFDYRLLSRQLVPMPATLRAFSPHTMAPQEAIDAILELKRIVRQWRASPGADETGPKVLNLSELTPIYTELDVEPPRGLPLWFHTKVALFPDQIQQLEAVFAGSEYDFILLQGAHEGMTETYKKFHSILETNRNYLLVKNISSSPGNATWRCEPDCEGNIFIYLKTSSALNSNISVVGNRHSAP